MRGEFSIAPLVYNIIYPKERDGAPVKTFFPPEGVPIVPYGSGIPKTAQNPNAARLYMDWLLSEEGQIIPDQAAWQSDVAQGRRRCFRRASPRSTKVWVPKFAEFESLYGKWIEEWNKVYGYRQ